jgi:hypothetical protein
MTKALLVSTSLLAIIASIAACNIHDNTINATANIPNAQLSLTADADVDNVMPAQPLPMTVTVMNVTLVEPTATVPPGHEMDEGHLEFHLDDETTPALLVTAQTKIEVPIPADTKPGKHKVICRVHKHDGEATDTKVEVEITVKVNVSISGAAGADGGAAGAPGTAGADGAAGADGGATIDTTTTVEVDASVVGSVTN